LEIIVKKKLAITGSKGDLGAFLVKYFDALGYIVQPVSRDKNRFNLSLIDRGTTVIHSAFPKYPRKKRDYEIYMQESERLFRHCKIEGAPVYVISTLSIYSKYNSKYIDCKLKTEDTLVAQSSLNAIIRPGIIKSNKDASTFQKLKKIARFLRFLGVGDTTPIKLSTKVDIAIAIVELIEKKSKDQIFEVISEEITLNELSYNYNKISRTTSIKNLLNIDAMIDSLKTLLGGMYV
jgi:hypothetical protein